MDILQKLDELFSDLRLNFTIGELKNEPDTQGAFKLNGFWYLYSINNKGEQESLGAFTDKELLYVMIMEVTALKDKKNIEYTEELLDHIHEVCGTKGFIDD